MGRVKTRLAREIGSVQAAQFYRTTAAAVIARLSASTQWQTWLAVAPDGATGSACWPADVPRRGQGKGDLGQRMQRIMQWPGPGPIVIVGTDIPAIAPSDIAEAFRLLGRHDAVFGPAGDGGYWLVGIRRSPRVPDGFGAVRWSSANALSDTLANLAGLRIGLAATLDDVDDAAGLAVVRAWSGRRTLPLRMRSRSRPRPSR